MASPLLAASRTATFSTTLKSAASTKSILKRASRPTPLPLSPSPFPFTASFHLKIAAAAASQSPHVHFPPSPLLYSTISAASFDISSVFSSTLPSATASEAEPTTSPLSSPALLPPGFKLMDPPKPKLKLAVRFQDPRSPRPASMTSLNAAALTLGSQPSTELSKALVAYPRSPYPSAPLTPERSAKLQDDDKPRKRRNTADNAILTTWGTNDPSNSNSTVTFQLTTSRRLAPPHLDLSAAMVHPGLITPIGESAVTGVVSASPESALLNDAFWESVSLEDGGLLSGQGSGTGFPESVTGSQVSDEEAVNTHDREHDLVPRSPAGMLFGDRDGTLWSPGLLEEQDRQPRFVHGFSVGIKRSSFAAPSPKDPLARFPTFVSAVQRVAAVTNTLTPPPRVHLV